MPTNVFVVASNKVLVRAVVAGFLAMLLGSCLGGPDGGCGGPNPGRPQFVLKAQGGSDCPPPPPPPDCDGCITGDPHITTFDDRRYDFQAAGEFVAISGGGNLEVQIRTQPFANRVSSISALAADVHGDRVMVDLVEGAARIRVDGDELVLRPDVGYPLPGGGVLGLAGTSVVLQWVDGTTVAFEPHPAHADMYVELASQRRGALSGLLGDADGIADNDLRTADGQSIGDEPDDETLHGRYADSWRVTDESSLFDYDDGESTSTYTVTPFPIQPARLEDLTAEQRAFAEAECSAAGVFDAYPLTQCLLDVGITGDASYAASAAALQLRLTGDQASGPVVAEAGIAWVHVGEGELGTQPLRIDSAGHVLMQSTLDDSQILTAFDARTGSIAWTVRDVSMSCPVTPSPDGRVLVFVDQGSELAIAGSLGQTLVALDATSGELVAGQQFAVTVDEAGSELKRCEKSPLLVDNTFVVQQGAAVFGIDVSGQPTLEWTTELAGRATTDGVVADNARERVFVGARNTNGVPELIAIDIATGSFVGRVELPGTQFPAASPPVLRGDIVAISTSGSSEGSPATTTLTGVSIGAGDLAIAWILEGGRETPQGSAFVRFENFTASTNSFVGWAASDLVVAVGAATGAVEWTYEPSQFRNTSNQPAVDDAGRVFVSTFTGNWLEAVDSSGMLIFTKSVSDLFDSDTELREAAEIGPLQDGLLFVMTRPADGEDPVLVAVEVGP